jgi:hypothetical protein
MNSEPFILPYFCHSGEHETEDKNQILTRRKRGMAASNPLFIIPGFFLHFPNELFYGYPRFEGNGKISLGRYGKKSAQSTVSV